MMLLAADLHLTNNARDVDRWNLFPWIETQVQKHGIKEVALLGDLTDSKDKHAEPLVNKVVSVINSLAKHAKVIILRGNHDFIAENAPYFRFLNIIPNVVYVNKPKSLDLSIGKGLFLPCTRNPSSWNIKVKEVKEHDLVFTHQTYEGSVSENGTQLSGAPVDTFKWFKGKVWSGDVHGPQKIGNNIEYVGAPYPIRFGDNYKPRLVLLGKNKQRDLHFEFRRKELIELKGVGELPTHPENTQVKIRVTLERKDFPNWAGIKSWLEKEGNERKWEVCGIELVPVKRRTSNKAKVEELEGQKPTEVLKDFAKRKKLDKGMTKTGIDLLKGFEP